MSIVLLPSENTATPFKPLVIIDTPMTNRDLPPDNVYERGMNFQAAVVDTVDRPETVRNQIDWDQTIDMQDDVVRAANAAATQFHYANTSHLLLCGKIIKQETAKNTLAATKLAATLTLYKIEGIENWGKYMARIGDGYHISDPLRNYYQHLFSEHDVLPLFLGMETLAGPVAYTLYSTLQDAGDDLFQQLNQCFADQKAQEIDVSQKYLANAIDRLPARKQDALADTARKYLNMANHLLRAHEEDLTTLDIRPSTLQSEMVEATNRFYERINLSV